MLSGVIMAAPASSPAPQYTALRLTLRDVLDAVVEYDVRHQVLTSSSQGFLYGQFDPNPAARRIYLNTEQDHREMLDTVVHELYHAKFHQQGITTVDHKMIDAFTKLTLHELYGYDLPAVKPSEEEKNDTVNKCGTR